MATTRQPNTKMDGSRWSEEPEKQVWAKGRVIPDFSPELWRWDICGSVMKYSDYGNRNSQTGWEIDHINPNGSDDISNLQPLNWNNNAAKSDKTNWKCGQ